jgi:hypothetical protein
MLLALGAGAATALAMRSTPALAAKPRKKDGYAALGMAIMTPEFRRRLATDPDKALSRHGLQPTAAQREHIAQVDLERLATVRAVLDRISTDAAKDFFSGW